MPTSIKPITTVVENLLSRSPIFDVLLLLALPASGKSEVRRFMRHGSEDNCVEKYHLGDTVQLDDFPYIHFMRVCDDGLAELGHNRLFYPNTEEGFYEGRDWGTLLRLVNQDFALITDQTAPAPTSDPQILFERIDKARADVGAPIVFANLDAGLRAQLADKVHHEAVRLTDELFGRRPDTLDGRTVVIEFARGGPHGASCPLPDPHGYQYSLSQLSPAILEKAAILYLWVTPEESRRKNIARCDTNDPGSILHHSCPETVMMANYGTCDMAHLMETSDVPGTVRVESAGQTFNVPVARFDNRVDRTTFVRDEPGTWNPADVTVLERGLAAPLRDLWNTYTSLRG